MGNGGAVASGCASRGESLAAVRQGGGRGVGQCGLKKIRGREVGKDI